jgi:hypothetical protein
VTAPFTREQEVAIAGMIERRLKFALSNLHNFFVPPRQLSPEERWASYRDLLARGIADGSLSQSDRELLERVCAAYERRAVDLGRDQLGKVVDDNAELDLADQAVDGGDDQVLQSIPARLSPDVEGP